MRLPMMTNSLFVIPGEPRPARRGKGIQEWGQYPKAPVILERARYARILAGDESLGVYGTVW